MSRCKSCDERVTWAKTVNGKLTPMDYSPAPNGNARLIPTERGGFAVEVLGPEKAEAARTAGERLYMSHFATCVNAARHRR